MKILTIVGARPQFIKASAVSRAIRNRQQEGESEIQEVIVHTGQHYDSNMSGIFFEELDISKPKYNLGIGSGGHGKQTGLMIIKVEEVLLLEKPSCVLVYGDTNSTLAGALAASKLHIPIAHVEAGLRSFNRMMPEEINRVLTDHVSDLLFTPTKAATEHLLNEGVKKGIVQVGDVMYDSILHYMNKINDENCLESFQLLKNNYYLATVHRAENTNNPEKLKNIFNAYAKLNHVVVIPMHPRTKLSLIKYGLELLLEAPNLKIIPPVSYLEMLALEKNAKGIFTDSGGIQKEAYFLKVPCLTLRTETEWEETLSTGWNRLVDPAEDKFDTLIEACRGNPYDETFYGDGKASEKILNNIINFIE